jgi:hypothetical protein
MKSAYGYLVNLLNGGTQGRSLLFYQVMRSIWKCKTPIKCLVFCWQVFLNLFPCKSLLQRRGVQLPSLVCSFCSYDVEDASYLFVSCPVAFSTWIDLLKWLGVVYAIPLSLDLHFLCWSSLRQFKKGSQCYAIIWVCMLWSLWLHHNNIVFNQSVVDRQELLDSIKFRS